MIVVIDFFYIYNIKIYYNKMIQISQNRDENIKKKNHTQVKPILGLCYKTIILYLTFFFFLIKFYVNSNTFVPLKYV